MRMLLIYGFSANMEDAQAPEGNGEKVRNGGFDIPDSEDIS